jgi:DNA-binding phage protein
LAKKINQDLDEGVFSDDLLEKFLADVRGHLWHSGDWGRLAAKANLNVATISKIAYGETKSPHARTILKIMYALGKLDSVLDSVQAEKPISEKVAHSRLERIQKKRKKQ